MSDKGKQWSDSGPIKRKNSLWLLQIWEFHRVILFGFNRPREKKMKLVEEGAGDCLWGFPRELDSVVSGCKQPLVIMKCKHELINTNLKFGRLVLALASYFEKEKTHCDCCKSGSFIELYYLVLIVQGKKMKLVEEGAGDCLWGFPRELDSVVSSCKQPLVIIKCKHKLINTRAGKSKSLICWKRLKGGKRRKRRIWFTNRLLAKKVPH